MDASNENKPLMLLSITFLCTQKVSTLLESVSVAGRPAVRMHDSSSRHNPIVMKFCA
jgi:hypothetical protein